MKKRKRGRPKKHHNITVRQKDDVNSYQPLGEAGNDFPCLSCLSRGECTSFKWFLKWFGTPK